MIDDLWDIKQIRKETRGCHNQIHFNNAGASLMPIPVSDTLHDYLESEEYMGGYETAAARRDQLNNFYLSCSGLLNCDPAEIAFAENATRAWDMAFYSFQFKKGDKILTTYSEYGSNIIAYQQQARRYGVGIEFIPNDATGQIDTKSLEKMIDERVRLISISHIPTGSGLVNPAAKIGKIAGKANIPYLLDACQSVGHMPVDVKEIGCDILSGTGRKYLRGPRGTGFLYVKQNLIEKLMPPFLDLHAATLISATEFKIRNDAKRFENWEQNFAGKAALGVAMDYAQQLDLAKIKERIYHLSNRLRKRLANTDGVVITDEGQEQCGIITFMTKQLSPLKIKSYFKKEKINVTTSEGSGNLILFNRRGIKGVVRASLHYYNTEEEIDVFMDVLLQMLRQRSS